MACTGHCNQCAAHPGYVGPGTATVWTDDPLESGIFIKDYHWDELRDAIDAETTRRSEVWSPSDPGNVDVGDKYNQGGSGDGWRDLRDQVSYLDTGTTDGWRPSDVDDSTILTGENIFSAAPQTIRDRLNVLEEECVCDCNYSCTCDCNYCTCDCNYCTCNCNYCTCNCNYPCTCNCAYASDERLKREIEYL